MFSFVTLVHGCCEIALFFFLFPFLIKRSFESFSPGINMIKSPETKVFFFFFWRGGGGGGGSEIKFVISHHTNSSRPKKAVGVQINLF